MCGGGGVGGGGWGGGGVRGVGGVERKVCVCVCVCWGGGGGVEGKVTGLRGKVCVGGEGGGGGGGLREIVEGRGGK